MDCAVARTSHCAVASLRADVMLGVAPGNEPAACSSARWSCSHCSSQAQLVLRRGCGGGSARVSRQEARGRGLWTLFSSNLSSRCNYGGAEAPGFITCEKKDEGDAGEEGPVPSSNNGAALPPPLKVKVGNSAGTSGQGPGDGAALPSSPSTGRSAEKSKRAGLRRTPITGGVQSATSSNDLPHPSVAVRNLIEQARYAHLCTIMSRMHHRRRGYPFGSLVDFATDPSGRPIFHLSPLAIHTRNLLTDPRCTLVVQMPGWNGLANARVTLFGDVYPLPAEEQEVAHKYYSAKHQHGVSQRWGDFYYYRMEAIGDIYFVGGFGTVAWVDVEEYRKAAPDHIATADGDRTLQELNNRFSKPLRELLTSESEVDDAALISIDSKGIDIRVRQGAQVNIQRLSFDERNAVETIEQAERAILKVLDRSHTPKLS